jgi:hypothetical protein
MSKIILWKIMLTSINGPEEETMLNDGLTKEELAILLAPDQQIQSNRRTLTLLFSKLASSFSIKKPSTSHRENERPDSMDI